MVDTWFLMGSPMPMLGIVTCYASFVLKIGPKLMASRKPFNLKPLLVVYNFSMILLSLYIVVMVSHRISMISKEKRKNVGTSQESLKRFKELILFAHERQFSLESVNVTAAGLKTPIRNFMVHIKSKKIRCPLVQALRLCTGRTAHRGSRGIALPFLDHGTGRG